ncbi:hypothetical protein CASFOL_043104 [Castilleja foliolosa]|uniref:Uncharacterized protein n=1 Tax=Castilleja foliolosa TaxID=1961234 RepID=A0ABD3B6Q6_9LAMI
MLWNGVYDGARVERINSFLGDKDLGPYEEKTSYTVLGGVLFIYIYPNEPSIESLQLMFDPEEKEKIFKKGAQPTETVQNLLKKAEIFKELPSNQMKFN